MSTTATRVMGGDARWRRGGGRAGAVQGGSRPGDRFFARTRGSDAGWSSLVARRAHNPKVAGSNPAPAMAFARGHDVARTVGLATLDRVTIQRMDHVGIVVDDLADAVAFFVELGLELQGESPVAGGWVDRVVGLEGVRAEIAMLQTPDGHGRVELAKFHAPSGQGGDSRARRTPSASATLRLRSTTSMTPSPGCKSVAQSSSARWSATRTSIGSATSAARRGSSSSWRSGSAEGSGWPPPTGSTPGPSEVFALASRMS